MEFVRKKKRGQNKKVRRTWSSEEGYRIVWRKEVCGVHVPARYQAMVQIVIPNYSGVAGESFQMWDFVDSKHHLYKVLSKAQEACERHLRLWTKACEATGIRSLVELFGKVPTAFPVWARKRLNRKVYELLTRPHTAKYEEEEEDECSSPLVLLETSDSLPTSATGLETPVDGPASSAEGDDGTTTRTTRHARSKATSTETNSPAKPATKRAKGQRKPSSKHTAKPSKDTAKGKRNMTASSKSAELHSNDSRRKRSTL